MLHRNRDMLLLVKFDFGLETIAMTTTHPTYKIPMPAYFHLTLRIRETEKYR